MSNSLVSSFRRCFRHKHSYPHAGIAMVGEREEAYQTAAQGDRSTAGELRPQGSVGCERYCLSGIPTAQGKEGSGAV
jgi:hypothetical protein